jgi:hypothetical protein
MRKPMFHFGEIHFALSAAAVRSMNRLGDRLPTGVMMILSHRQARMGRRKPE